MDLLIEVECDLLNLFCGRVVQLLDCNYSRWKPTTRQPRAPYSSWIANMPVNSVILRIPSNLSPSTLFIVAPCLLVISLLTTVHLYTFSKYHWSLSNYTSAAAESTKWRPPPPIPYTIPFLGHAIAFLTPKPGEFWANLIRSCW